MTIKKMIRAASLAAVLSTATFGAFADTFDGGIYTIPPGFGGGFTAPPGFGGGSGFDPGAGVFFPFIPGVPEPESYAMLLAGLCLVGAIARRRNKSKVV